MPAYVSDRAVLNEDSFEETRVVQKCDFFPLSYFLVYSLVSIASSIDNRRFIYKQVIMSFTFDCTIRHYFEIRVCSICSEII